MFAEMIAMITPKDYNGIVSQFESVKGIKHATNLGVDKGYTCIICLHSFQAGDFIQSVMRNRTIVSKGGSWNIFAVIFGSIRQPQCFQWIHIEVFFGSYERCMWTKKAGCDKERLSLFFLHQLDRFGGDHPVSLFFILPVRSQPAKGSTNLSVWFRIENQMFIGFVPANGIDRVLPGWRIVKTIGSNRCRYIVMIYLTNSSCPPSMFHKLLG